MTPSQVLADKQGTKHQGEASERVNHHKESECHKPKMSDSTPRDKNLVLLATKREMKKCVRTHQVSYTMSYYAKMRWQKLTLLILFL